MKIEVQVLHGPAALEALGDDWAELLARAGVESYFMGAQWLKAWAEQFGDGDEIILLLALRDSRWIGGLPLVRGKSRIGRNTVDGLQVAGRPYFDLVEIPCDPGESAEEIVGVLFDALDGLRPRWTALELRELPVGGLSDTAVAVILDRGGWTWRSRVCSAAPTLEALTEEGEPVRRGRNLRSQLRRSQKRLAEKGAVEICFERIPPDGVTAEIERCTQIEAASWKGAQSSGVLCRSPQREFFEEVWRALAQSGELAVGRLDVGGEPVAYHWGWIQFGRFYSYNLAYLEQWSKDGPGSVLLDFMVTRAPELGIRTLDASRGDLVRPHGLARYHGPVRDHHTYVIFGRGLCGRLLGAVSLRLLPALRRLRAKVGKD